MGQLKSSGLVEVEVLDTSGVLRGNLILEIIGQSLDAENGLPVIYVTLLASDSDAVLRWAIPNPGTPNGIHLSNRVVSKVPAFNEDGFVLVVERWRQRDPASVTEDWAKEAEAEGGAGLGPQAAEATAERREASAAHGRRAPADDQPGAARRAPGDPHGEPDRRAHRDLPGGARGGKGTVPPVHREPAMERAQELAGELLSEPGLRPPGLPDPGEGVDVRDDTPGAASARRSSSWAGRSGTACGRRTRGALLAEGARAGHESQAARRGRLRSDVTEEPLHSVASTLGLAGRSIFEVGLMIKGGLLSKLTLGVMSRFVHCTIVGKVLDSFDKDVLPLPVEPDTPQERRILKAMEAGTTLEDACRDFS